MRALIKSELHMDSRYVDIAIAESIEFNRKEHLKFNGASDTITLAADVYKYELPKDFISFRGDVYITPADSDDIYRQKMNSVSVDFIEDALFMGPVNNYSYYGLDVPHYYAVDNVSSTEPALSVLLVAPKPTTGGQKIFFRYTKDLGTPRYTATTTQSAPPTLNSTVTLLGPDGETLAATFTNEWFKTGARLIRSRAMFLLWSTYHGGTEEASVKAQTSLLAWQEELLRLRTESNINSVPNSVRRYL